MKRNIIIIGGGLLQLPIIETARGMGLYVIVFDMSPDAPGMRLAHEPVLMSTRDIDGCVREAKKIRKNRPVHGVVTAGTDASRAVAAIAAALDLPGIRYADAEAASNKVLMRKRLRERGVPIPDFAPVWSLKEAREAADRMEFPLVMKPADNMGARGVIKVVRREDLAAAYRHSKTYTPTGEMILEEYMEGPELSVDALSWKGKIRITGIADRIIAREPYFIELGHNMPSALDAGILREAEEVMRAGMIALGLHTGAGKGDLKVTKDGVKVGEIAARLSGGFMSSHTYPIHSGVNLLRGAIQIALGDEPDGLEPTRNRVAVERGILGPSGRIVSLSGKEEMESVSGVEAVYFTRSVDQIIPKLTSNIDKVGHVIASGETLADAERAASMAMEKLHLVVDDTFSIEWHEVEERARERFGARICHVCRICDGRNCASGVPGMGGAGKMNGFRDNSKALEEIRILPRYIRPDRKPDTSLELFGIKLDLPVMAAPMTGTETNMNGVFQEGELARILLGGCHESGSVAWLGDGASPDKYLHMLQAAQEAEGRAVIVFKPRADTNAILDRIRAASALPVLAVGLDIDSISLRTMELRNQSTSTRTAGELRRLRDSTKLPFVLKGILTVEDAEEAVRAGVDAIVVSNHGGRVLDDLPGSARVLPDIAKAVGDRITVLADGGIRSGLDVFKMVALGAKGVLVGRPMAIAAVGGEIPAVKFLLKNYRDDLERTMRICGVAVPGEIDDRYLLRKKSNM